MNQLLGLVPNINGKALELFKEKAPDIETKCCQVDLEDVDYMVPKI